MTKKITVIIAVLISFCLGFSFESIFTAQNNSNNKMKKVTGIGGIFF